MFSFARSRSRLRIKNSWSRLRNPYLNCSELKNLPLYTEGTVSRLMLYTVNSINMGKLTELPSVLKAVWQTALVTIGTWASSRISD